MNKYEITHEWIDRYNDHELSEDELKEFLELLNGEPEAGANCRI